MAVDYGHYYQIAPFSQVTPTPSPGSTPVTSGRVTSNLPSPPHRMTSYPGVTSLTHLLLPMKPSLPPCRVCGGKASGYHYGVNTCQGCRVSRLLNVPLSNTSQYVLV